MKTTLFQILHQAIGPQNDLDLHMNEVNKRGNKLKLDGLDEYT